MVGYDQKRALCVEEVGSGGIEEMTEKLTEEKILYAFLKYQKDQSPTYIYIRYLSLFVPGLPNAFTFAAGWDLRWLDS